VAGADEASVLGGGNPAGRPEPILAVRRRLATASLFDRHIATRSKRLGQMSRTIFPSNSTYRERKAPYAEEAEAVTLLKTV